MDSRKSVNFVEGKRGELYEGIDCKIYFVY